MILLRLRVRLFARHLHTIIALRRLCRLLHTFFVRVLPIPRFNLFTSLVIHHMCAKRKCLYTNLSRDSIEVEDNKKTAEIISGLSIQSRD